MLQRFFLLFGLSFTLFSCEQKTIFTETKVEQRYSISIPSHLQRSISLHPTALLQYQNTEKDFYVVVIDEKKIALQRYDLYYDIDSYFKDVISQPFIKIIENAKVETPNRKEINGNKALVSEITGTINNTSAYYKLTLIETPYEFYQIIVWVRAINKEEYKNDIIKIIESFKELPHPEKELPQPKLNDSLLVVPTV